MYLENSLPSLKLHWVNCPSAGAGLSPGEIGSVELPSESQNILDGRDL